ncbi:MAG: hypothetical protein WCI05_16885, partial [Myxococcales bacterium]
VLVEKPLCATSAEAHGLVAAATRAARHLFVGHSERFNPVVRALRSLLRTDASPVVSLQFRREAPRRAGCDAGVLVNLAVHDFDLIAHITGGPVTVVAAVGDDDTAHVLVRASGATAHLHVSRVAPAKRRTLVVQTERFLYEGDLLGPRLTRASADGETTDVPLATVEPLVAQAHALALALTGTTSAPLATGTHGAQAVFLAEQAEILLRMDEVD